MEKRFITRIEFEPATIKWLTAYHKKQGMTQVAMLSRLVQWFAAQPPAIQLPILGKRSAETDQAIGPRILQQMADPKPAAKPSPASKTRAKRK